MKQLVAQCVIFTVVGAAVFGLSKLLRCKDCDPGIDRPRRSSLHALVAVGMSMSLLLLLILRAYLAGKTGPSAPKLATLSDLVPQALVLAIYAVPAGIFMVVNKESLRSVRISGTNLWQAALIGMALAALTFYFRPGGLARLSQLTIAQGIALVYFSFVGFGEEFLFRGYLQTRLVAWSGTLPGWVLASVIMALIHFPHRLLIQHMGCLEAFANSVALIPVSLLMGFIVLRIRNLLAPGLFHTFANWTNQLN